MKKVEKETINKNLIDFNNTKSNKSNESANRDYNGIDKTKNLKKGEID